MDYKNIILAVAALLMVSCGQPSGTKKTAAGGVSSPVVSASGMFLNAGYKEYPIQVSFDFAGDPKRVFDVYNCYSSCTVYMRVDCTTGTCSFSDPSTKQVRADIDKTKTKVSASSAHIEWTDLLYQDFGASLDHLEVQSTSGIAPATFQHL